MKKVLDNFRKIRVTNKTQIVRVERRYTEGAIYNGCVPNSWKTRDTTVYGWLVWHHKGSPVFNFTPHAWNVKDGKHYDTTPLRGFDEAEMELAYVIDWDLDHYNITCANYNLIISSANTHFYGYILNKNTWYEYQTGEIIDHGGVIETTLQYCRELEWMDKQQVYGYGAYTGDMYGEAEGLGQVNLANISMKEMETV